MKPYCYTLIYSIQMLYILFSAMWHQQCYLWSMMSKMRALFICRLGRPRSDAASAQSVHILCSVFPELLDTLECNNGQEKLCWCVDIHNLNLLISHLLKDTFWLDLVHMTCDKQKGSLESMCGQHNCGSLHKFEDPFCFFERIMLLVAGTAIVFLALQSMLFITNNSLCVTLHGMIWYALRKHAYSNI